MDRREHGVSDPDWADTAGVAPPTTNQVVALLGLLSRRLEEKTREIASLDEEWVNAKRVFKREYARIFLTTTGSMDVRKQTAVLETDELDFASELAEAKVRAAREAIRTLRDRLDVGRSLGAAARAEFQATGWGQHT